MGNFISHSFGLQKKTEEDVWTTKKGFRFLFEKARITNKDVKGDDIIHDIRE